MKRRAAALKSSLMALVSYSQANASGISLTPGLSLEAEIEKVRRAVLRAAKYRHPQLKQNKRRAIRLLQRLYGAVP